MSEEYASYKKMRISKNGQFHRWLVPLYLLIAASSIRFPLTTAGLPFRLFVGNILFMVVVAIGLLRGLRTRAGPTSLPPHILLPTMLLILQGLVSIIYARLNPTLHTADVFQQMDNAWTLHNIAEMLLLLGLPLALIVMPQFIQQVHDVRRVVMACTAPGLLYALIAIWTTPFAHYAHLMMLTIRQPSIFSRATGISSTQLIFFVCIALGQALYARRRVAACCWWLTTLILILATTLSLERTAWITLCVSAMVMLGLRHRNIGVIPLILALLLPLLLPIILHIIVPNQSNTADDQSRWWEALDIWQRHPWLGVGAGNYQFAARLYGMDAGEGAHNQFLELLAEMGLQGVLCLLWMIIAIGYISLQRFMKAVSATGKAIALSYLGYYTTLLILSFSGNTFLPSLGEIHGTADQIFASYHWLLLGIVLALPRWEIAGTHPALPKPLPGPQKQLQTEREPST
ncbi:O-antigen ligase family protein [Dictyobacter aurantiacus]|uniref:O-antigen ligase-related domain-containing protein n=1 Tax=Dictyobacter aurantiacus TaxID=1936993 RepID=A0A401ZQH2_9CHLR|nr:O-antigen ligase family protein [Dictyobacter aurantiacus]GCE09034.1 hypothetical protein KDAU_63630 [Dictyobacter aurantiacus]